MGYVTAIPALGKLTKEKQEFKANLNHIVSSRLSWNHSKTLNQKQTNKQTPPQPPKTKPKKLTTIMVNDKKVLSNPGTMLFK